MRILSAIMLFLMVSPLGATDFATDLQAWRDKRVEGLLRDESWTSLVGLHWLDPAVTTRLGSGAGSDVAIAGLPGRFGTISTDDARWRLALANGVSARIDGEPIEREVVILDPAAHAAARSPKIEAGRIRFVLIERAGRVGMRVWDTQAPTRTAFPGIDAFPGDPAWRVTARWQPHVPARSIDIATVIGTVEPVPNPGAAVFERDGRTHTLEALRDEGSDQLFFIFADRTSGRSTYGAGRYLYTPLASDGAVVLDFNRAFNPPCAFSEFATCPLPPPENRLDLPVTAGEQTFRRPSH